MKRGLYQYLYSLLFAILTVLGFYYGQLQQYISADNDSVFECSSEILSNPDRQSAKSLMFDNAHETDGSLTTQHPRFNKIRANLSENDTENDDTVEPGASSALMMLYRDGFWHLISDFVTTFHDRKIAISLAHFELLKPLCDDLYIQYRVIRL